MGHSRLDGNGRATRITVTAEFDKFRIALFCVLFARVSCFFCCCLSVCLQGKINVFTVYTALWPRAIFDRLYYHSLLYDLRAYMEYMVLSDVERSFNSVTVSIMTRKASCCWQTRATLAKSLHGLRKSIGVVSCIASLPIDSLPMVSY